MARLLSPLWRDYQICGEITCGEVTLWRGYLLPFFIHVDLYFPLIFQIAEALLEKESLSYQDMEALIGPPIYPKA